MSKCAVCNGTKKCAGCNGHFVSKKCAYCNFPLKGICPRCKGTGEDPVR